MLNKFILILLTAAVLASGCIFDKDNGTTAPPVNSLIPQTNLPAGITFMGIHEITLDIGGTKINATEGVYRNKGEDVYIQVIESGEPEALVSQYKLIYKNRKYSPFEDVSFNGHKATKITDYTTINGKQQPNYAVIWAAEKAMILVASPTADVQTLIALATATGS